MQEQHFVLSLLKVVEQHFVLSLHIVDEVSVEGIPTTLVWNILEELPTLTPTSLAPTVCEGTALCASRQMDAEEGTALCASSQMREWHSTLCLVAIVDFAEQWSKT